MCELDEFIDRGGSFRQGAGGILVAHIMPGEQCRGDVAGAVAFDVEERGLHLPGALVVDGDHFDGVFGPVRPEHRGDQNGFGADLAGSLGGLKGGVNVVGVHTGEVGELELVRGDDVGDGHNLVPKQGWDEVGDEAAGFRIAHDRVAGVKRVGVFGLDFCHGVHNSVSNVGSALVAGEDGVNGRECAAGLNAVDNASYLRGGNEFAGPLAVAGVVRKVHGVDGPNLVPDALQWENGGGVSHMPVGNVGLD